MHTGGASRYNYPQVRYTSSDMRAFELAKIFGAPYIIRKPIISKSLRKVAKDKDIPIIVFEGGESLRFDGYSIQIGLEGILRVLESLDMVNYNNPPKSKLLHFGKTVWVRASQSGLFMWSKPSGSKVVKGEIIGVINDPQGLSAISVLSPREGYIIGHNNASVVNQGCLLYTSPSPRDLSTSRMPSSA